MYNSDYDVHNAVFVDHLNTVQVLKVIQIGIIQKTGNSGDNKITRSYTEVSIKCKDYDATIDISNQCVNRYRWRE